MNLKRLFRVRLFTLLPAVILFFLIFIYVAGNIYFGAPAYKGMPSDHFDGKVFFNIDRFEHGGFSKLLKWRFDREHGAWLEWVGVKEHKLPPLRVESGGVQITFIGHSSLLIQMDGKNILCDPVWSQKIGPLSFIGISRHRPPGIDFELLPKIDVVLITHNHYDHMDIPTIEKIAERDKPIFITGLGNKAIIEKSAGPETFELDWWNEKEIAGITFAYVPTVHFSSRSFSDHDRSLWGGFIIKGPSGVVYFAGDTGMGTHFEKIKQKYGPPLLVALPIGAYKPRWFMSRMHTSPGEVLDVYKSMEAKIGLAIHHGTFRLGDDGQFEAVNELLDEIKKKDVSAEKFWVLEPGQSRFIPSF